MSFFSQGTEYLIDLVQKGPKKRKLVVVKHSYFEYIYSIISSAK